MLIKIKKFILKILLKNAETEIKTFVLKLLNCSLEDTIKELCVEAQYNFKNGQDKKNYVLRKLDEMQTYLPQAKILQDISGDYYNRIVETMENKVREIKNAR